MNKNTLEVLEFNTILSYLSDFAISTPGKERCLNAQIFEDINTIKHELLLTSQAKNIINQAINIPLENIYNIENCLEDAKKKLRLREDELIDIAKTLRTSRLMKNFFENTEKEFPEISQFKNKLYTNKELEDKIFETFTPSLTVKEDATPTLKSLYQTLRDTNQNIKTCINSLMQNSDFTSNLQDTIYTQRDGRTVFQVKAECKNKVSGIVHDISQSSQTYFIEPEILVGLNNKIRQTEAEIKIEVEKILRKLSSEIGNYFEEIKLSNIILIEIDFILAKAKYSISFDGTAAKVSERRIIQLKSMKNPVLIKAKTDIVENDFYMTKDKNCMIITGSNTGGKTVVLKTAGLCTLMTKAGMHIPCYEAELYPFKKVYADIGDEQSIIQNLSTFSAHMTNIVNIINHADEETLILLDEIAAGTDPKEGASLAKSIMEEFVQKGALSLISTHFNELKSLPFNNKSFQNGSVDFNVETLTPTYKLRLGIPGASNAFAIAKNFGIPEAIIENAKKNYESEITDESKVLEELQTKYSELNKLTEEAQKLKTESEAKYKEYSELLENLNSQKRKTLKDYKRRYEDNLQDAKQQIKKVLENLNHHKTKENAINSYKKLSQKGSKISQSLAEEFSKVDVKYQELAKEDIQIGAKAIIKGLDQDVVISSLPDSKGNLQVMVGQLKSTINIKKLAKSLKRQKDIIQKKINLGKSKFVIERINMSPKLDLRGYRVDEALLELEAFLDKASMVNLTPVEIIHGHGTGQLRIAVRDYLSDSPYVAKYRQGEDTEGGNGVTIVDINENYCKLLGHKTMNEPALYSVRRTKSFITV